LDFENFIQISQAEIAAELEMQRSNVSRSMKRLIDLGVIRPGPKVGRSLTYQLHPDLAWKGKSKTHHKAREEARKAGWEIIEGGSGKGRNEDNDQMSLPL
ncbi:MAG: MarR family transcriptional regulator, partial [Roseinatronobacter sp.]